MPCGDTASRLLAWYDDHHRDLPWRVGPAARARGVRADPYAVWLSEVMLQQTTVAAVKPYFLRFRELWPDVTSLASAPTDDVMKAWAGLGYYSRARNLKACAEAVSRDHGGRFPESEEGLRALPGIGTYTAAAIAAIAFDQPSAVVDGNVERVISRLAAIERPVRAAKPEIRAFVAAIVPLDRPGDFAQAMMDLGATICTPKRPACILCPLRDGCLALATGDPARFPIKAQKAERPVRYGTAFVAVDPSGAVLLRKRPDRGLLGGMTEVPGSEWTSDQASAANQPPFPADWQPAGTIDHVFTHFALRLAVYRADRVVGAQAVDGWWSKPEELAGEALPTVMKKAIEAAIPGATRRPRPV